MSKRRSGDVAGDVVSAIEETNGMPSKRPRRSSLVPSPQKLRKRKKGYLEPFKEMPLDILYEVIHHLEPMDLLNLARTTKFLRETVLKATMAPIWQSALRRAGLPTCPSYMNTVQYTEFMLNAVCDNPLLIAPPDPKYCFKRRKLLRLWSEGIKVCVDCVQTSEHFVTEFKDYSVYNLCGYMERIEWEEKKWTTRIAFSKANVDLYSEWDEKFRSQPLQWSVWAGEVRTAMQNRIKEADPLKEWFSQQEEIERLKQEKMKEVRFEYALEMLAKEGWEAEVAFLSSDQKDEMRKVKCLDIPKPLDEKSWIGMKAQVIGFIEKAKAARLEREYIAAQSERLRLLKRAVMSFVQSRPIGSILPLHGDYAIMPEFIHLIKSPTESTVSLEDFSSILEGNGDELVERWRDECDDFLLTLIQDAGAQMTKTDLESPTTTFKCRNCSCFILYPQVLVHECTHLAKFDADDTTFTKTIWDATNSVPWNSQDYLRFSVETSERATRIRKDYGFDFSIQDLLRVPVFECLDCPSASRRSYRVFLTWSALLNHHETPRHPLEDQGYRLLNDNDANIVLKQCSIGRFRKSGYTVGYSEIWPPRYICSKCHMPAYMAGPYYEDLCDHEDHCFSNEDEAGRVLVEGVDFVPHLDILSMKLPRGEGYFKLSNAECTELGL